MKLEQPSQFNPEVAEHNDLENDSRLESIEQVLAQNLEGLQEDIKTVDPEKFSPEDTKVLRTKGEKIFDLIGGLSGMGVGAIEAARSMLDNADSTTAIIAAIGFTIGGGLKLLVLEMERRREKKLESASA